jgi:phosphoglycolate phosphatase
MTRQKTIFFDLDGTLTDSRPGITRSIQHALERLGLPVPEADALTWCIGPPLVQCFTTLLGSDVQAAAAIVHYRERYGTVGMYENEVYAGIPETLAALKADGHTLHVATAKPHVYAERIIAHFGFDRYFTSVFGPELDGTRNDKRELLAHAIARTGTDPAQALMIGDRHHDILAARANAVAPLAVLYGYGSRQELAEAGAERFCASPAEVLVAARGG